MSQVCVHAFLPSWKNRPLPAAGVCGGKHGCVWACMLMSTRLRTFSLVETDGEHALSHEGLPVVLMLPWLAAASAASQRADAPPAHNVPTVASVHRHASRSEWRGREGCR